MTRALVLALLALALPLVACSKSSDQPAPPPADGGGTAGGTSTPPPPAAATLTQADIDLYVKLSLDFAANPKTEEGQKVVLEKNNTTQDKWFSLYQQVRAARTALIQLEKNNVPIPAHLAGDAEIVKANREKIEAAISGKAVK
jgi:hypothetical protein